MRVNNKLLTTAIKAYLYSIYNTINNDNFRIYNNNNPCIQFL